MEQSNNKNLEASISNNNEAEVATLRSSSGNSNQHTPNITKGRWVKFNSRIEAWDEHNNQTVVCRMEEVREWRANAELISAAPDLLEALKSCLNILLVADMKTSDTETPYEKAKRAITKATGGVK